MKRACVQFATVGFVAALAAACGTDKTAPISAKDLQASMSLAVTGESCKDLWNQLEKDREALAETDAWKAVEGTEAFKEFYKDLQRAHQAHCKPYDPSPTIVCDTIGKQIDTDWQAVKLTPEYKVSEATDIYQKVRDGYAALRDNHCWENQD